MKILIADDHGLVRDGIGRVLEALDESVKVVEAAACAAALDCAEAHPDLDLVLLDLNMPDMSGLAALERFGDRYPGLPVVVVSAESRHADMQRALQLGAMGFIPKQSTSQVMIEALRRILAGEIYIPPALSQAGAGNPLGRDAKAPSLTKRQREVLLLLAQGQTNKEIARSLDLAQGTVKMHIASIMNVLDAENRTQAVLAAERLNLV